ncbi:MAG: phage antirepressor KilAC domain-containing protein [Synergistaceae bacterium]|jgi:anti-repressor protein|nr:phage antirepressor KilAC domain-containing protein [Synergistaceae bacterium]
MGNSLQIFDFEGRSGRFVLVNGEPWFVAKDILLSLDYAEDYNPSRATAIIPDEWKGVQPIHTLGGIQNLTCLSEQGVYFFLARSDKSKALAFQKKIAGEILPSIRRYGAYMTPQKIEEILTNPDTIIGLAQALKREQEKTKALAAKAEADYPKVLFADSVSASNTSILVGELAKLLRQNGVEVGQNRLFEILRNEGYLVRGGSGRNMPTQRAMERGLFEIKEITINRSDGGIDIKRTPKVTGRGQVFFVNKFLAKKPLEM